MMVRFRDLFWMLGLMRTCLGGLIASEPLETRLCRADYVFKFQVTSDPKMGCLKPSKTVSTVPTSRALPSPVPAITNDTKPSNTSSRSPPVLQGTTVPTTGNQTVPVRERVKRFCFVTHQEIKIIKKDIYRGSEDLKHMDFVKVVKGKDYYLSRVRHDLNYRGALKLNGNYLFVGRKVPNDNVKNHVFLKNLNTVVPWDRTVEQQVQKFDFKKKDCRIQKIVPTVQILKEP